MPIPSKGWKKHIDQASAPKYPDSNTTYNIDPAVHEPVEDQERQGRFIMRTKQGCIYLWRPTVQELAIIISENAWKPIQIRFERDAKGRSHPKVVKEKLQ